MFYFTEILNFTHQLVCKVRVYSSIFTEILRLAYQHVVNINNYRNLKVWFTNMLIRVLHLYLNQSCGW